MGGFLMYSHFLEALPKAIIAKERKGNQKIQPRQPNLRNPEE